MTSSKKHALLWATVFLFLVAFILHVEQLFWMSAATALLLPVSILLSRHKLSGLAVSRQAPKTMQAGEIADITLRVYNRTPLRRLFIQIADTLPPKATEHEVHSTILTVTPGEEVQITYTLATTLRGVYRLGPLKLETADTLGLVNFSKSLAQFDEIVVYPLPVALPSLWPATGASTRTRRPMRVMRGQGLDFYGVREYLPSDDIKRVDWKATARLDDLMITEYHKEEGLEGLVILDLFAHFHGGQGLFSSLEQGVLLATSAIKQAQDRGASVGLVAVGNQDYSVPAAPVAHQYHALVEALARLELTDTDNWTEVLVQKLAIVPRGSSVIVLSPRTDESALTVAQQLRARRLSVSWFVLQVGTSRAVEQYNEGFIPQLQSLRCTVKAIDCSAPLQAQFGAKDRSHA